MILDIISTFYSRIFANDRVWLDILFKNGVSGDVITIKTFYHGHLILSEFLNCYRLFKINEKLSKQTNEFVGFHHFFFHNQSYILIAAKLFLIVVIIRGPEIL